MKITNNKSQTTNHSLTIGWLYPELMSTYGDRGNIIVLAKRCEWRGIEVKVKSLDVGFKTQDLRNCDLLFMGGAQDTQQKIVSEDLTQEKVKMLREMIESSIPGAYVCGAYQFLGKYYKEADGTVIEGLGIFDLFTESPSGNAERLIGNIVVDVFGESFDFSYDNNRQSVVGFENHGGRTYLGKNINPFGTVKVGFGNNGIDKTEGAIYKNSIGTYMHGPILPKNPMIADWLIRKALRTKYKKEVELKELNDSLELKAQEFIIKKLFKKII